ncbi:hypothetical protein [Pseudooceanicola algae]|uniref:Uncharacterized protein n=1 Tax=Pseudooceanicola algae TaxID=1537215 RepID=A0A418SF93_9RHOB|nr:hypothetical protein [Pseudooceanicola algae]QPM89246.1 hypothetical protein PSAL_004610 [Pseudooceanicola algae]
MSAPDTEIAEQEKRHRTPIWGIVIATIVGLVIGGAATFKATSGDPEPGDAAITPAGEGAQVQPVD